MNIVRNVLTNIVLKVFDFKLIKTEKVKAEEDTLDLHTIGAKLPRSTCKRIALLQSIVAKDLRVIWAK